MPVVASGTTAGGDGKVLGGAVFGTPGEIMKVSLLKRPAKLPTPTPNSSASMSPKYQARPNGLFGTSILKRSKSVFGGRPKTSTSIFSNGPKVWTVTLPFALRRQDLAVAETVSGNIMVSSANGMVSSLYWVIGISLAGAVLLWTMVPIAKHNGPILVFQGRLSPGSSRCSRSTRNFQSS